MRKKHATFVLKRRFTAEILDSKELVLLYDVVHACKSCGLLVMRKTHIGWPCYEDAVRYFHNGCGYFPWHYSAWRVAAAEARRIHLSIGMHDPEYRFADIENLVRKARIDLDAEIEFYSRQEAACVRRP